MQTPCCRLGDCSNRPSMMPHQHGPTTALSHAHTPPPDSCDCASLVHSHRHHHYTTMAAALHLQSTAPGAARSCRPAAAVRERPRRGLCGSGAAPRTSCQRSHVLLQHQHHQHTGCSSHPQRCGPHSVWGTTPPRASLAIAHSHHARGPQPAAAAAEPRSPPPGDDAGAAQEQSLGVLEWPAVSRQVGCFCGTSMAAEALLAGRLPIGRSRSESNLLLQQTQEALVAQLDVAGVFDLRPALEAAGEGGILNARQLEGVATSMESSFELRAAACAATDTDAEAGAAQQQPQPEPHQQQFRYPTLAALAAGIQLRELSTLRAIRSCIRDGGVVSEASPELASVREARQGNREAARQLANRIARELHAQGAAEGRDAMLLRGRYCVAVKRSRRSAVSKGSVKLGESGTGATLYLEPSEVLELNNREAQLADAEATAELAVLQALSQFLAERAAAIEGVLSAVTALDIVAARAKHARWCNGVRPLLLDAASSSNSSMGDNTPSPLALPGAKHPLLLQPSLPPLPRPPSSDDACYATDFVAPPLFAFAAATASAGSSSESDDEGGAVTVTQQQQGRTAKPLQLAVPASARVVAITGPNTGGKTVMLKTAGLLALMSKAGLFVPCEQQHGADGASSSSSSSGSDSNTQQQPALLWFDQVLADIGDSQSLQQNLSTFSGHIARLKLLLAAAGPDSLVLLDEVGSGTDPLEGSALARAVLDVLAGQARLTLATSHHAELKTAADEDARYVNVSLAFDTRTLQPTYALQWGAAGASNALDIAQALGFDSRVLADARILVRAELGKREQQAGRMEKVAASVEEQLAAARASLAALTAERQQREQEAAALQAKCNEYMAIRHKFRASEGIIVKDAAEQVLHIQTAVTRYRAGKGSLEEVQAVFDACAAKVGAAGSATAAAQAIKAGDTVVVPRMSVAHPFMARVAKVSGDTVFLEGSANPLLGRRGASGMLRFKMDEVVPAELVQVPAMAGLPSLDVSSSDGSA